jgi:hypothetical protein
MVVGGDGRWEHSVVGNGGWWVVEVFLMGDGR